jgi:anti-anti-sigma regulatory factor
VTYRDLAEAVDRSCAPELTHLTLDLSKVTSIDSNGVRALDRAAARCEQIGASFDVLAQGVTRGILGATGVALHQPARRSAVQTVTARWFQQLAPNAAFSRRFRQRDQR